VDNLSLLTDSRYRLFTINIPISTLTITQVTAITLNEAMPTVSEKISVESLVQISIALVLLLVVVSINSHYLFMSSVADFQF